MTDGPGGREPARTPTPRGPRFKPQALELADGGRLILRADGSIERVDAQGATTESWTPDHAGWPAHALRFGLHSQAPTIAPHGRVQDRRPPRR